LCWRSSAAFQDGLPCSPSAVCLAVSEGLILASKEQECKSSGRLKKTHTAEECSKSTGRTCRGTEKSRLSHGRWKKLDDAAFASAKELYEAGKSLAQIAASFGVSRQSLWNCFRRRQVPLRSLRRYGAANHFFRGGSRAVDRAQGRLEKAVLRGVIVRPKKCEKCGDEPPLMKDGRSRIQAHHPDYSKPLEVRWLCQRCHHLEHKNA
jgi:hypothetical protein